MEHQTKFTRCACCVLTVTALFPDRQDLDQVLYLFTKGPEEASTQPFTDLMCLLFDSMLS